MGVTAEEISDDAQTAAGKVLVAEPDPAVASLLQAALMDEGYAVTLLGRTDPDAVRAAVGRLEPDCLLLAGEPDVVGYGRSWDTAALVGARERAVPTVMLTSYTHVLEEARNGATPRSAAARFEAILAKPFDLDELLAAVATAVGRATPFDGSEAASAARTAALAAKLRAVGVEDVRTSTLREWATFRAADGAVGVLYWSQRDGVYYVLRQAAEGGSMLQVGRFHDADDAVAHTVHLVA